MKAESLVFAVAGLFLGLIAGWLIGSQQPARSGAAVTAPSVEPSAMMPGPGRPSPPPVDAAEVARYEDQAARTPADPEPRIRLGNLYFDAERYPDAIRWYEQALEVDPTNADVSTDLGVSYYYTNQLDRALAQFARSLEIDPQHTKTMLNQGIVLAFGRQDLEGAARSWQRVVELAPQSPEGQAARRALETLAAAHPGMPGAPPVSAN